MNNSNTQTSSTYTRKAGLFGSAKTLGLTIIRGANEVTIDSINTLTGITGSTATASAVLKEATAIFGNSLIEDLRSNELIDQAHRSIEQAHATAELDRLKEELARVVECSNV